MSTEFNFPANPTIGDIFTLPNGSETQWNGTEWELVIPEVVYPIGIDKGGTDAITASDARINLGLNTDTGEFIIPAGTVTNPGLAFSVEPGLGWYRYADGAVGFATAGSVVETLSGTSTSQYYSIFPQTDAAITQITLHGNTLGSATQRQLYLLNSPTQGYVLGENLSGGETPPRSLTLGFNGGIWTAGNFFVNAGASSNIFIERTEGGAATIAGRKSGITRWTATLGNQSDYFTVSRLNASGTWIDDPILIDPNSGWTRIGPSGATTSFQAFGLDLPSQAGMADWGSTIRATVNGTGWTSWGGAQGYPVIQSETSPGDKAIWWLTHVATGQGRTAAIGAYGQIDAFTSICLQTPGASFQFYTSGSAQKPGSATWDSNSDERVKDNIFDYTTGLDAILSLRPRTFKYKADSGWDSNIVHTGLVAQECEVVMPELVTKNTLTAGTLGFDDMRIFNANPLFYALINAVKTLHERIQELETK